MNNVASWAQDWEQTQRAFENWWQCEGMVLWMTATLPKPREPISLPMEPNDFEERWCNPHYRIDLSEYRMSHTEFFGEAFPQADIQIGPGSLGTFLGANPQFAANTVWYQPCIADPETYGPICFETENNHWLDVHLAMIDEALKRSQDRWLVGIPDLIENLDTLAALRGDEPLFFDLIERPGWVSESLAAINEAFFQAFDIFYNRVKDDKGGSIFNPFAIWGPGKTAKVQCDTSASISPRMFRNFVAPYLDAQCRWLDYSLYHLDGTTCLQHLDNLLEIDSINAIEWTPQDQSQPSGGSPYWYDLYKRIKSAGKGVQVIGVRDDELIPLLDAIGPEGTYVMMAGDRSFAQAEKLLRAVDSYRML